MLQILIVTIGLGLANCQALPRTIRTAYETGYEYVYDYESQIFSGLPLGAKAFSGIKLWSKVLMQVLPQNMIKIQLSSPRLYQVNDVIDRMDPTRTMVPTELFTELLDDDAEMMKREIMKPVTFFYERGHVSGVTSEEDDPNWSLNIKRAVLSLFEMNFNERQSLTPEIDFRFGKIYRVIEPSVAGECETMYRTESATGSQTFPSFKVHKVRIYENCIDSVFYARHIFSSHPCDTCAPRERQEHLSAQSSVKYNLLGSKDQFVIVSAVAESRYNVVPYSEDAGKITTISNQTLTLFDSHPTGIQISELRAPVLHKRPLKLSSPETETSYLSPKIPKLFKEEKDATLKKITKVFAGLEQLLKDSVQEETGYLVHELRRHLAKLDKPSLKTLWDTIMSDRRLPKARKVFLDVLPSVGSYPAVDILLERIEKGELPAYAASKAFIILSFFPEPDFFIVKRFMDYIETYDINAAISDKSLRRFAWLALGSLGSKMMNVSEKALQDLASKSAVVEALRSRSNAQDVRKKLDLYAEELKTQLRQTKDLYTGAKAQIVKMVESLRMKGDKESMLLALKVMANLKYEEFIPMLEAMLQDNSLSEHNKVDVLHCLWYNTAVKKQPRKIESIYLPVFLDRQQPDTVRMMAYRALLMGRRLQTTNQMIIQAMEEEENDNMASFMYSSLHELSKIYTPCDDFKALALNSTFAKRFLKAPSPASDMSRSSLMAKSTYDTEKRLGHTYMHALLYSPSEMSPRYAYAVYTATALGKSTDVLELTYSGVGLDSVLGSVLSDSAGTSLESVLKAVLYPRMKRSSTSEAEQRIRDIKNKVGVQPKESPKHEGHIGFRLFGHEVAYFDTESVFGAYFDTKSAATKAMWDKFYLIDAFKALLNSQYSMALPLIQAIVPTEAGFPLKVYVDAHATGRMDGDIQMNSAPKSSEQATFFRKMNALFNVRPSALMEVWARVEADMTYIRSGVHVKAAAHTDVPFSATVNIDPDSSKWLIKLRDEKEMRPFKFESRVHTVIRRFPSSADQYPVAPFKKEIKVIEGADLKWVSYQFGQDVLGRNFKFVGEWSVRKDYGYPVLPLSGCQYFYVKYEPLSDAGLDIQFQHISADSASYTRELPRREYEEQAGSQSSWLSSLSSWFSSDKTTREQKPEERMAPADKYKASHTSSQSRESAERYSDAPTDSFIDLEQYDASIDYLKNKFQRDTTIMPFGVKSGMVFRIADSSSRPRHQVQISTLYQADESGNKVACTMEIRRTPTSDERKPWKMVTDMQVYLPVRFVEPSDLMDMEYQKQIQKQIMLSVSANGQQVDSLADLGSKIITQVTQQVKKMQKPDALDVIIEDVVNYVMEKAVDAGSHVLKAQVQKQRQLQANAGKLSKQPSDPETVEKQMKLLQKIFALSSAIKAEVAQKLLQTPKGALQPEDSIQVLCIIASQEKTQHYLRKVVDRLQPVLSVSESGSLEAKLKEERTQLEAVKSKQMEHATAKQSTEAERSKMEIAPEQRSIHAKLLDAELKLITWSGQKSELAFKSPQNPESTRQSISPEERYALAAEITKASDDIKNSIDAALFANSKLNKMVRVKMAEVVLYQKLVDIDMDSDIKAIDRASRASDKFTLRTPQDDFPENRKKTIAQLRYAFQAGAKQIADRLEVAIKVEQDFNRALPGSTLNQARLDALVKAQIKQLQIQEALRFEDASTLQFNAAKPTIESIKKALDICQDSSAKVTDVINQEIADLKEGKTTLPSYILIKAMKVQAKQSEILDQVKQIIHAEIISRAAAEDSSRLQAYQDLRKSAQKLKDATVVGLKSAARLALKLDSPSAEVQREYSMESMLEQAHQVEVHQAQLKSLEASLYQAPRDSKGVDQKAKLYEMISKLQMSQDKLNKLHQRTKQKVAAAAKSATFTASTKSAKFTADSSRHSADTDTTSSASADTARSSAGSARSSADTDKSHADTDRSRARSRTDTDRSRTDTERSRSDTAGSARSSADTDKSRADTGRSPSDTKRSHADRSHPQTARSRADTDRSRADTDRSRARSHAQTDRSKTDTERSHADRSRAETARSRAGFARSRSDTARSHAATDRSRADTDRSHARSSAHTDRSRTDTKRSQADTTRSRAYSARSRAKPASMSADSARLSTKSGRIAARSVAASADFARSDKIAGPVSPFNMPTSSRSARASQEDLRSLVQTLAEKQKNQLRIVKAVEKKFIEFSRADTSLLQPLQRVQQLKDRIQRQQQETELLKTQVEQSSQAWTSLSAAPSYGDANMEVSGQMRISYGAEDQDKRRLFIRWVAKKSLMQLLWEQDQAKPEARDPAVWAYLGDRREPVDPAARDYQALKDKLNNYRHLHVHVAYEDTIPATVKEAVWKLKEYIKVWLHDKVELRMPDDSNMSNKINFKMEVSEDDMWTDAEIKSPFETTRFRNIRTPAFLNQLRLSDSFVHTYGAAIYSWNAPAHCAVSEARVRRVTGKTIEVDLSSEPCESVLAMDCSSENSLAVTSKPHPENPRRKMVKVLTKDRMVEIIPSADGNDIQVSVDGQPITVTAFEELARTPAESYQQVLVQKNCHTVIVKIPQVGVAVAMYLDGSHIFVTVPKILGYKLCGVCGSFDARTLLGPRGFEMSDPRALASAYHIPDSQCDAKTIQSRNGVLAAREFAKQVSPFEKTLVKERMIINGIERTCFSITPVKQCPQGSAPQGTRLEQLGYKCIRSSSPLAKTYLEAVETRVVTEVKNKSPDISETVSVHEHCVGQ